MIGKILVPIDGSPHADAAIDWASDLALKFQARLTLINVITERGSGEIPEELRELARIEKIEITERDLLHSVASKIVSAGERRARGHGVKAVDTAIAVGDPARSIVEHAKRLETDLIVMGRRGLGALPGLLVGSVSHKVLHLADCACLTVKS